MRRQGFTLVEVMVSLGVMTISAMALFGMQAQATRANGRARDMTMASQIAQNVVERLKLDGLIWNTITPNDPADLVLTETLKSIALATPGNFMTLPERSEPRSGKTAALSNAFNQFGDDVLTAGATSAALAAIRYCASMRLAWVYDSHRVMRADVRVWWSKEAPTRSIIDDFPGCADDNIKLRPGGTLFESYHAVYLSTVIRPHPL
jgi:prepilin-type N-terminal cleavage/methylation domain-containing protein